MLRQLILISLIALISASLAPAAQPASSKQHNISIKDLKYVPAKLSIKVGDTVVWTNKDDNDHTVISTDDTFESEKLGNGETYKYKFTESGKFSYGCSYHPRMKGTIMVTE